MKTKTFGRLLTAMAVALTLNTSAFAFEDNVVATDGSTSMEKVIGSLGEAFTNANPGVKFTYNPTGSGAGIVAALEGRTDIGLSSRALKDSETKDLNATTVALDGIVLIVNKNNTVTNLTIDQIKDIFTGKITSWKDLGYEDKPIVLIGREAGSGTRDGFESVTGTAEQCQYRQELTSTGDVLTTVSNNKNAIGYISYSAVSKKIKPISINGIEASEENIANGSYKLQRPFVFVTAKNKTLSDADQAFFNFALSNEAKPILIKAGVVPAAK